MFWNGGEINCETREAQATDKLRAVCHFGDVAKDACHL